MHRATHINRSFINTIIYLHTRVATVQAASWETNWGRFELTEKPHIRNEINLRKQTSSPTRLWKFWTDVCKQFAIQLYKQSDASLYIWTFAGQGALIFKPYRQHIQDSLQDDIVKADTINVINDHNEANFFFRGIGKVHFTKDTSFSRLYYEICSSGNRAIVGGNKTASKSDVDSLRIKVDYILYICVLRKWQNLSHRDAHIYEL
jgi:hypothetical protein